MNAKYLKIIIAVILVAVAGFFIYRQLGKKSAEDTAERMKASIIAPAKVTATDLNDEQKNKFLQRLKDAQDGVRNSNFDNLQSLNAVGQYKKQLGDIEGAITAWEYANLIRPKNSLSFSNLAALYHYDLKDYSKAESNYLISIANDPDDVNTIRNLFELYYYSVKDNAKAEALLLQSIEANPKAADLYALLANFYAETGNPQKALEYYRKNLELNPKNEGARKEVERLQKEVKPR